MGNIWTKDKKPENKSENVDIEIQVLLFTREKIKLKFFINPNFQETLIKNVSLGKNKEKIEEIEYKEVIFFDFFKKNLFY